VPDGLVELIVERSDGNPFFVEELIKMLTDEGVIRTDALDGRWTIEADRLDRGGVPATITGVLQARLDNLAPAERLALQCAAVVGRVFWDDAVLAQDIPDGCRETWRTAIRDRGGHAA
jgi:predicted ATPase